MTTIRNNNNTKKVMITYSVNNQGYRARFTQIFSNGLEFEEQLLETKIFSTEKKAIAYAKKVLA